MVNVSIEVSKRASRFSVRVRAESIQQAIRLAAERYPYWDCRVKLPINPEGFFVEDRATQSGIVGFEQPQKTAA